MAHVQSIWEPIHNTIYTHWHSISHLFFCAVACFCYCNLVFVNFRWLMNNRLVKNKVGRRLLIRYVSLLLSTNTMLMNRMLNTVKNIHILYFFEYLTRKTIDSFISQPVKFSAKWITTISINQRLFIWQNQQFRHSQICRN